MESRHATCSGCGAPLPDRQPARGLAHGFDPRPYCVTCLRLRLPAPTPHRPVAATPPPPAPRRRE